MGINLDKYQILDQFNVSRETCHQLDYYKKLVLEKNNSNLRERQVVDCAQIIDLIDKNEKICTDLGSGA